MGFLGDFLGGAADAGAGIISSQIKSDQELERQSALAKLNADLQASLASTVEQTKLNLQNQNADTLRTQKAGRIQSQLQTNADANIGQAPAALPETQADGTPMSDEAKANYAQAVGILNKQRQGYTNDPRNIMKAAVDTGDESPDKLASLDQKSDLQAMKTDAFLHNAELRNQYQMALIDAKNAATNAQHDAAMARVQAVLDKATSGGKDPAEKLTTQLSVLRGWASDMAANGLDKKDPQAYQQTLNDIKDVQGLLRGKRNGAPDSASPAASTPSADKYIVGKQYRDAKGNVATYLGNGQWK